jgi:hypothetical protein
VEIRANDAQKTMGIITLTLITVGILPASAGPPFWVIFVCALAIALGTSLGGWRIIQTMGKRISEIQSPQGFAAETSSAAVILTSAHLGFALSTTQVCTGSIFGAGAGKRLASVQWSVAGRMALAWLMTLPAAAIVGAVASWVAGTGTVGTFVVAISALAVAGGIYVLNRRNAVTAHNVNDVAAHSPRPCQPDASPTSPSKGHLSDAHCMGIPADRLPGLLRRRGHGRRAGGLRPGITITTNRRSRRHGNGHRRLDIRESHRRDLLLGGQPGCALRALRHRRRLSIARRELYRHAHNRS